MTKTEFTWLVDKKRKNGGRFIKKYSGQIFRSSEPNTKAGKAIAVQEFIKWKSKVDEELLKEKPHKEHYEEAIGLRNDMLTWLAIAQDPDPIKTRLLNEVRILETEFSKQSPKPILDTGVLLDPIHRSVMSMGEMMNWLERLESLRFYKKATFDTAEDHTLQQQIDAYINMQRSRASSGQIQHKTFKALQERTEHFKNWLRINNRSQINSAVVRDYRESILDDIGKDNISEQWGSNLAKASNSVILYLARNELCLLPANLNDPLLRIKVEDKEVVPYSDEELQVVWDNASERTKLYALLMLNCGMLPSDIADLKQKEFNGTHITRRRKKTGKQYAGKKNKVPMVSWLLWDETKRLLDKHRSKNPKWLLVNENGNQIVTTKIRKDGKIGVTSNVTSAWDRLQNKMTKKGIIVRPLEQLRKTGASKLEQHKEYGRYSQFFLGQAASSVSEKRYAPPSQDLFNEAMLWLGEQFSL
jgi:integrase